MAEYSTCQTCGAQNPESVSFCGTCGESMLGDMARSYWKKRQRSGGGGAGACFVIVLVLFFGIGFVVYFFSVKTESGPALTERQDAPGPVRTANSDYAPVQTRPSTETATVAEVEPPPDPRRPLTRIRNDEGMTIPYLSDSARIQAVACWENSIYFVEPYRVTELRLDARGHPSSAWVQPAEGDPVWDFAAAAVTPVDLEGTLPAGSLLLFDDTTRQIRLHPLFAAVAPYPEGVEEVRSAAITGDGCVWLAVPGSMEALPFRYKNGRISPELRDPIRLPWTTVESLFTHNGDLWAARTGTLASLQSESTRLIPIRTQMLTGFTVHRRRGYAVSRFAGPSLRIYHFE